MTCAAGQVGCNQRAARSRFVACTEVASPFAFGMGGIVALPTPRSRPSPGLATPEVLNDAGASALCHRRGASAPPGVAGADVSVAAAAVADYAAQDVKRPLQLSMLPVSSCALGRFAGYPLMLL